MLYSASSYLSLPQKPGVYKFLNEDHKVIYVGKAKQLKNRVSSYFRNLIGLSEKTKLLVKEIKFIDVVVVESELEALLLEANYIKKYIPKFNVRLRDGKNYPLIRITKKYLYPAVITARKMDDPESLYFGPFPNSSDMRRVLRIIRRIFPFHSTLNHTKRKCLYFHLGLCPCIPAMDDKKSRLEYKKTINHIIDFLEGKTKKVIRDLKKIRDKESKAEHYEISSILQKKIDAILYVTQPIHSPFEYEVNPNLEDDLRNQEVKELQKILLPYYKDMSLPVKIECYDISNTQGTNPTASMVVFMNAEPDTIQYRKFKIRSKGPNDFAMIQEVFSRRLNHKEWQLPNLFIVDGGKGQVSSAKKVLEEYFSHYSRMPKDTQQTARMAIPLVGLAKREETVITSDLKEIKLPRSSGALKLLMKIRDEAHRFALSYHRKLRSKEALLSHFLVTV